MKRLNLTREHPRSSASPWARRQQGKIGYIVAWLLGVPIPVLFAIFLLRGCD